MYKDIDTIKPLKLTSNQRQETNTASHVIVSCFVGFDMHGNKIYVSILRGISAN